MFLDCIVSSNAGCETMITSLGSPLPPIIVPPPLGIPPLKRRWRAMIGAWMYTIDNANHGCRLLESTLSLTVAYGMEVVGV